ncbi:ABC transporter ATP-binding protein [Blastococcus brunescens]|uniref:ABC transporter ATP-binding protein n=1 Tax=Blastococcus brunescens TaxID=1564165 RepID=A0ABZ1B9T5_9ACTN|nr:ABC transporter ATP-binding protein [Blastococcus sp. BMG 8361]WRL66773.1 ABC transporter ATP-binding protein [Blastococcus sp. BMG 8361]
MTPDTPTASSTPVVEVSNLVKRFRRESGAVVNAIDDVSFEVAAGDFVVLLGPSGCGKTTLLRAIAGLETPDQGAIRIGGRAVFSAADRVEVPPERRDISMIFQSYALWPHMTAFKNVAYPLQSRRGRKVAKDEIARRVRQALELVGVGELETQYPGQMSGGQQQRIALARALVNNDELVLFDEPLSNVDAKVREQLRFELVSMQRKLGFSALFVTHDQTEAMELAHRIAVLDSGRIAQFGTPRRSTTGRPPATSRSSSARSTRSSARSPRSRETAWSSTPRTGGSWGRAWAGGSPSVTGWPRCGVPSEESSVARSPAR